METILTVEDLRVVFDTADGPARAVDGVSFNLRAGEVLGLVGESGCGKSVTALSILRLLPCPPARYESGRVMFDGRDLLHAPIADLTALRGARISMIFQEPMTSLSPLRRIGDQMSETVRLHRRIGARATRALARDWLARVGLPDPDARLDAWPHELSGGMRQRVMIALALMLEPDVVIADEPTTALDVTLQAQVFDLLRALRSRRTAILLITHDMGAVWELCDRVQVMYAARLVERGTRAALFANPRHPYTRALMRARPGLAARGGRLEAIPGQVPSPLAWPAGCRFRERCAFAFGRCAVEDPPFYPVADGGAAACHLLDTGGAP